MCQGAFARAIGAHDGMYFTGHNLEVNTLEDFLIVNVNV
jgi:hypothetical protein